MNKKYIIGFGTGRVGTKSLAFLLNSCKGVNVSHEFRGRGDRNYRLSWYFDEKEAEERVKNLKKIPGKLVGDIGHYYLNYIPYLHGVFGKDIKFVNLFRDSKEVFESFLRKTNKTHWLPKEHPNWKSHEPWSRTFPKYDNAENHLHSLNKYLEEYYCTSYYHNTKYKDSIFILETKDINNINKQIELFDFLEIPESDRAYSNKWENKSW